MKGIVFAAGIGTRLKPFTDHHPKALAPIGNTTALGYVINRLITAGADAIVVNIHHFASQVAEWIAAQHYAVPIELSDESDMLLDTGGALAKIYRESKLISQIGEDEPIVVHNADIITDFPIAEMVEASRLAQGVILADPERVTTRRFLFDSEGWLRGWTNSNTSACRPDGIDVATFFPAAFDGVHCLRKAMLRRISDWCGELHPVSITDFYIEQCTAGDDVKRYTPSAPFHWYDIGTPERLATAQKAISDL